MTQSTQIGAEQNVSVALVAIRKTIVITEAVKDRRLTNDMREKMIGLTFLAYDADLIPWELLNSRTCEYAEPGDPVPASGSLIVKADDLITSLCEAGFEDISSILSGIFGHHDYIIVMEKTYKIVGL